MKTHCFIPLCLALAIGAALPSEAPISFDFLLPAEGDVVHAPRTKVVIRVAGGIPDGLMAVLDGVWLEQALQADKDVLTLELDGLKEGVHALRLMYLDGNDRIRSTPTTRFFVRIPEPPPPPPPPKLKQFGRVNARVEWKNEAAASRIYSHSALQGLAVVPETDSTYAYDTLLVGGAERPFSRHVSAAMDATYGLRYEHWEVDAKVGASTQENRFRQPVNRFGARAAYGPWAHVSIGDVYPEYNPLIFNGARVRGAEAGAALLPGESDFRWVYARAISGETQRAVPAFIIRSRFGGDYDTTFVPGTRAQNLSAFRIGTGGRDDFDAGWTLMKTSAMRVDSMAEAVNEYLQGPAPSDNLVTGLDARIGFWEGRLELYARGALSLYTRDKSLGAFTTDTSAAAFDPARYRRILVINPTTSGWEYLASDPETAPDYNGFLNASSAYDAGVSASFPWKEVVWETGLGYSHLGAAYHSEANPFLGANPGSGWNVRQGVGVWENRVYLGVEWVRFLYDFGDHRQREQAARAELKFADHEGRSSAWINAGSTRQTPRGSAPLRYEQDFDEVNLGGTRRLEMEAGTWNLFSQYGFTRSHFRIVEPAPDDPSYPISFTHAVTSSVLYKFRNSGFIPKVTHSYADNGQQRPTHAFGLGAQNSYFEKKLKLDANVLVNRYAVTATRNGTGFGQNASASLRIGAGDAFRLSERVAWQGRRVSMIAGANYERNF